MVVLGIWVVELGYALAYAGWCSWNGGQMSILDAFTGKGSCGPASSASSASASAPPAAFPQGPADRAGSSQTGAPAPAPPAALPAWSVA